jgi:hypothetical protein
VAFPWVRSVFLGRSRVGSKLWSASRSRERKSGGPDAAKLAAVLDGDHDNGAVTEALDLLRRSPALAEARRTALAQVADQVLDRQV